MPAVLLSSNLDLFIPYWVEMVNLSLSVGSMDSLKTGILTPLRLNDHLAKHNLIDHKYAYRKANSTELLLLKVVNDLYYTFDKNMPSVEVLLDLSLTLLITTNCLQFSTRKLG